MMVNELKRYYFLLIFPLAVIFITIYLLQLIGLETKLNLLSGKASNVLMFVITASFGIAFPTLYRTWFAKRTEKRKSLEPYEFLKFEKRILLIALVAPYLAVIAIIVNMPIQFLTGIFLIALYSLYFFYPSKKRIGLDKKIFRVK